MKRLSLLLLLACAASAPLRAAESLIQIPTPVPVRSEAPRTAQEYWTCSAFCWSNLRCFSVSGRGRSRGEAWGSMVSSCGGSPRGVGCNTFVSASSACSN